MGLFYLALTVIAITGTALIAKLALRQNIHPLDLATAMFVISTGLGAAFLAGNLPFKLTLQAVGISAVGGLGGSLAVVSFNAAVRTGHFGFSNAIYRCSFLVPVAYAVLFLGSSLRAMTVAGIALVTSGILLMSQSTAAFVKGRTVEFRWFVLILSAFLLSGAPRIGQTLTTINHIDYFLYLFLSYLIGTAMLLPWALSHRTFASASLVPGTGAAIASYAGVFCTLKALETLKPQVVFPVSLSGPILLGIVLSLVLFKEKIRVVGWFGIVLSLLGMSFLTIWR